MVIGTPCSGPSSLPLACALSAAFAALSASSERSTTTALSFGLTARMRPIWTFVTSTAEIAPERIAAAVCNADHCQTGPLGKRSLPPGAFNGDFFFGAVFFKPLFLALAIFLATSHLRTHVPGTVRAAGPGVEEHRDEANSRNLGVATVRIDRRASPSGRDKKIMRLGKPA